MMLNTADDMQGQNRLKQSIYYLYHLFDWGLNQKNTIHLAGNYISTLDKIY